MADVQVTSAKLENGTLTVTGSGFTRTTTQLFVDDSSVPFDTAVDFDGTEITAQIGQANTVWAVKGGVESEHIAVDGQSAAPTSPTTDASEAAPSAAPGAVESEGQMPPETPPLAEQQQQADTDQSTTSSAEEPSKTATPNFTPGDVSKDDQTSDVSEEDLATAANQGAETKAVDTQPDRTALEQGEHLPGPDFRSRVENTAAGDLNIDPRQPYPSGNPPDPKEKFFRTHGYYEGEGPQSSPKGG